MRYGFGVDVGGTTVKLAWFDQEGTLLHKWEIPTVTEGGGSAILPDIAKGYCSKAAKVPPTITSAARSTIQLWIIITGKLRKKLLMRS